MKRRVLLIGYNFHPEPTGIGKYSGEMMQWLAEQGHACTVITAYPYYPYWQVQKPYDENRFWYKKEVVRSELPGASNLEVLRCPMYIPSKPTGAKRILLDSTFLVSAFFKVLQLVPRKKYDLVIVVAPSFQFGLLGIIYKRLRNTQLLYHIQDMQIEAARELGMIKSDGLVNALLRVEKFIFNQSTYVSSISEGMVERIKAKAGKDILMLPNWVDTSLFFPISDRATLKEQFGFDAQDRVILYSGSVGEKQGLEAILYAAKEFEQHPDFKFLICGSGPYKEKLQQLATELGLPNVVFFPLQPFDKFNAFLNMADVHLVIQKAGASDLVMPSKLTTILAVGGLALITANQDSGLHTIVKEHNMGLLVAAENQAALNEGLRKALTENNDQITANARAYAQRFLSKDMIMRNFEKQTLQAG